MRVVEQFWGLSHGLEFQSKITNCGNDLWRWGGEYFKKYGRRIQKLRDKFERLRGSCVDGDVAQFQDVEGELR